MGRKCSAAWWMSVVSLNGSTDISNEMPIPQFAKASDTIEVRESISQSGTPAERLQWFQFYLAETMLFMNRVRDER